MAVVGLSSQRASQGREPTAAAVTTTVTVIFVAATGKQPSTSGLGFGQRHLVSDSSRVFLHFSADVDFDQRSIHNVSHSVIDNTTTYTALHSDVRCWTHGSQPLLQREIKNTLQTTNRAQHNVVTRCAELIAATELIVTRITAEAELLK